MVEILRLKDYRKGGGGPPPEGKQQQGDVIVNRFGMPLRPGVPVCPLYKARGICPKGMSCPFNHRGYHLDKAGISRSK